MVVTPRKARFVLFEPVSINVAIVNSSRTAYYCHPNLDEGLLDGCLEIARPDSPDVFRRSFYSLGSPPSAHHEIKPGETVSGNVSYGVISPNNPPSEFVLEISWTGKYRIRAKLQLGRKTDTAYCDSVTVESPVAEFEVVAPEGIDATASDYLRTHGMLRCVSGIVDAEDISALKERPPRIEAFLAQFPASTYSPYLRLVLGTQVFQESESWKDEHPFGEPCATGVLGQPREEHRKAREKCIPILRQCAEERDFAFAADAQYFLALAIEAEAGNRACPEAENLLKKAIDSGKCRHSFQAKKELDNVSKWNRLTPEQRGEGQNAK